MNNTGTSQARRTMYPTTATRGPAFAHSPTAVHAWTPQTANISRFVSQQTDSLHETHDGHWTIYAGLAVFSLAATFILSSNAVQRVLNALIP